MASTLVIDEPLSRFCTTTNCGDGAVSTLEFTQGPRVHMKNISCSNCIGICLPIKKASRLLCGLVLQLTTLCIPHGPYIFHNCRTSIPWERRDSSPSQGRLVKRQELARSLLTSRLVNLEYASICIRKFLLLTAHLADHAVDSDIHGRGPILRHSQCFLSLAAVVSLNATGKLVSTRVNEKR